MTKLDKIISETYASWRLRFIGEKRFIYRQNEKLWMTSVDPRHWTPEDMKRTKSKVRPKLIAVLHTNGKIEYH